MNFGPADSVDPVEVDPSVRFTSIGGLKEHIECLKEMIIFPLMYPELFKKFNTRPAKGVLFHGPPGTGKTLLARALANECSTVGGKRVAFFMRKGADVMNKYYGESERNLRVLFETARKMKPSIIFFDEIDALAPVRKPTQDNTQSSIVATLLAEMDGLCDRGNVILIGATNRPEAMDPAVRRAGRFDRELYFPPPELEARKEILHIYTKDWDPELSNAVLDNIAKITVGYLGSDIKSLCSEAVLKAVKRVYPQIYECDYKLLINAQNVEVTEEDMIAAMEQTIPTGARYAPPSARPLPPHTLPLLRSQVESAAALLNKAFPPPTFNQHNNNNVATNESSTAPSVFCVCGECAETLIAPALLSQLEHCFIKELSVPALHSAQVHSPEHAVISLFSECRNQSSKSCVIFIRDLLAVWTALDRKNGGEVLLQMWRRGSMSENILLLAAWDGNYRQLPKKLQEIFPIYKDCIYEVCKPTANEVTEFLNPVVTELPLVPPIVHKREPLPTLPRAPTGPKENEEDSIRRIFKEYENLRLMRSRLRVICRSLAADRRYNKFATVETYEDCENYHDVVQHPMDFSMVLNKIDCKKYSCAKDFLEDIDLIATNAFMYQRLKPEKRAFREDAVTLHTDAYSMVAEEVEPQLELECQLIARKRRQGDDVSECSSFNQGIYMSKLGHGSSTKAVHDLGTANQNTVSEHTTPSELASSFKNKMKDICALSVDKPDYMNQKPYKKRPRRNIEGPNPKRIKRVDFKIKRKRYPSTKSIGWMVTAAEDLPEFNPDTENNEQKPEILQVTIDKTELEEIAVKYSESLRAIGLKALLDLHTQLSKAVYRYSLTLDRTNLPKDMDAIICRYLAHVNE